MNASSLLLKVDNLEVYTPVLEGWRQFFFSGTMGLVTLGAFFVQRAVYRTLKKLGDRYINQLIIPSQMVFIMMTPWKLTSLVIKAYYYPIKVRR